MTGYTQLTQQQRYQIYAMKKVGFNQSQIAADLEIHKSTVSRELRRNEGGRGYRPQQAHQRALERRQERARRPRINADLWAVVESKLREQWSPQQIAGRLELERGSSVSHESIYGHIYADKRGGGTLHQHLRSHKKRRKRYGSGRSRRGLIPQRRCISERPAIVERRERIGDWEGDTIVGKGHRQAIVSLTERFSRYTLLQKVDNATATQVSAAIREQLKPWLDYVLTLTTDNGKEFALHQQIAAALQADYYFAHPYASWERGLNENTNGLVRQYCPKKSDFSKLCPQDIEAIVEKLNHRPRKTLGYRTPHEVFFQITKVALTT